MKIETRTLTGVAVLAALAVVFDYTLKYSGFKISFPWLPFLKFDFTGIPVVLSMLMYGLIPGFFTSAIAGLAILARSSDIVGASMKALAEFSTVVGMNLRLKKSKKFWLPSSFLLGIAIRMFVMSIANFILIFFGLIKVLIVYLPLIGIFNIIQGSISMVGGYLIYKAVIKRIPAQQSEPITGDY